jgi:hypothetical protein
MPRYSNVLQSQWPKMPAPPLMQIKAAQAQKARQPRSERVCSHGLIDDEYKMCQSPKRKSRIQSLQAVRKEAQSLPTWLSSEWSSRERFAEQLRPELCMSSLFR